MSQQLPSKESTKSRVQKNHEAPTDHDTPIPGSAVDSKSPDTNRRRDASKKSSPRFRLNLTIYGEPAEWVGAWRERGLIASARDLVIQSLRALHDKTVQEDLKCAQLKSVLGGDRDE